MTGSGRIGTLKSAEEGDAAKVATLVKELKKVERKSPTLGAKPPAGAIVLFDGTEESLKAHWKSGAKKNEAGLLMQGCTTTDEFQSYTMHIEFALPFMPNSRGQGHGAFRCILKRCRFVS